MTHHILFDLDGTLIDSAPSILDTLKVIFEMRGINPAKPLHSNIIGPPLPEVIEELLGVRDASLIDQISRDFASQYDLHGYKHSVPYHGIESMLNNLVAMNHQLYIVTNKRLEPTRLIIDHLRWNNFFHDRVYAPNAFSPSLNAKAEVMQKVVAFYNIPLENAIYIGDRIEDHHAAHSCSMEFLPVNWGYGCWDTPETPCIANAVLQTPSELDQLFLSRDKSEIMFAGLRDQESGRSID